MKKDLSKYKTFGQRCKALRLKKGVSISEVARAVGCTPQYLAKIEKEKHAHEDEKNPPISKFLFKIAGYFERDPYWLLTGILRYQTTVTYGEFEHTFHAKEDASLVSVYAPIITWDEVASSIKSAKDVTDFETRGKISIPKDASLNCYGLVMSGCSMNTGYASEQNFSDSDKLLFDPDREPKVGDFVLARIKKEPGAVFRQLLNDCGKLKLVPLSAKFKEIDVTEKTVEIIGVLCKRETLF